MSTITKGLSVETYEKMVDRGILPESNSLELIEGRLVEKMHKGPRHCNVVVRTGQAVNRLLPSGWLLCYERPIRVPARRSEPEPDISILRGSLDDYEDRHPGPGEVALVVEVSRSSFDKDRKLARIYAAALIPTYWIVNVPKRQLEVYSNPISGQYPPPVILDETRAAELVVDGQLLGQIPVADLLPRRP
jgi:Uma2 family endonuclease